MSAANRASRAAGRLSLAEGHERQARRKPALRDDGDALDEFGPAALEEREADAIDRGEIRDALGDRGHARFMRAGDDYCAEEERAAHNGRNGGAEQIHAGVAVMCVEGGGQRP